MRDLPVFTTQYGAASLVLREIPYQAEAYVHIQATQQPKKLIEECVGFCRAVGAERVYATGHSALEAYPFHTAILRMTCMKESLGETDAAIFPVQPSTAEEFCRIYNEKVKAVPNGAWMTRTDREEMLKDGDGYFVHRNGKLLGIGRVTPEEIRFLTSVVPGAGADVVRALTHAVLAESVQLEVASANTKAMALYERLGFLAVAELSRWYRVFPEK